MATAKYVNTEELNRFLGTESSIPSYAVAGEVRIAETVSSGTTTAINEYHLNNGFVIAGTYNFTYSDTSGTTILVETTDFTFEKDKGKITFTVAGTTAIGTAKIFAEYSFNSQQITDTQLQAAIDRAQDQIFEETGTVWTLGSGTPTPDYTPLTNEKHTGKGRFERDYFLDRFPLPDVSTFLKVVHLPGSSVLEVNSTDGFLNSGFINIGLNKIRYTGKNAEGTAFIGCSGATAELAATAQVVPYVIELSTTDSGASAVWTVLQPDIDFDIDLDTGKVHLYRLQYDSTFFANQYPQRLLPGRFRASYIYGYDSIPGDVKRLTLMIAAKDILNTVGRKALVAGQSIPNLEQLGIDNMWIEKTLATLTNPKVRNI